MPAPATHYIFAKSIENRVASLDKTVKLSTPAFVFGTQGPDFLFSHKIWTEAWKGENLIQLGSDLHNGCPSEIFGLMREYLENEQCDKDIVRSYIYGFIAHYSLDRMTHPFVYANQDKLTKAHSLENYAPLIVHNQIELNIDAILAERELGCRRAIDLKMYKTLSTDDHLVDEMSGLMKYVVDGLGRTDVKKEDLADAYRHMHLGQIVASDITGVRRKLIKVIEKPLHGLLGGPMVSSFMRPKHCDGEWDYMNDAHEEWSMMFDSRIKSTKSFTELYNEARQDTLNLIKAFNSEDKNAFKECSGDMSFNTGLRYDITEPIA